MFSFPTLTFVFNPVLTQIPTGIFVEIKKLIVNFLCECKEPRISKTLSKNDDKVGKLTIPDFKVILNKLWHLHVTIQLDGKTGHTTHAHDSITSQA